MKDLILILAGFYLCKLMSKPKALDQLELLNDARLTVGNGDQYKATIFSSNPIKAAYNPLNKNNPNISVNIEAMANNDLFKISGVPYIY